LLKIVQCRGDVDVNEINVAQAGSSIGGLIAAGLAFTIPGILFLNQEKGMDIPWPNPWLLALLTAAAGILGILLSMPLKRTFIDEEELPYPAGTAGAELLRLGKTGGSRLSLIVCVGAAAAIFALLRGQYFAAGFTFTSLAAVGIYLTLVPLPLAIGSGYILGHRAGFSWFVGAVIGWIFLMPYLISIEMSFENARALTQNLGMGIVLGSGIGFFAGYVAPRFRTIFSNIFESRSGFMRLLPLILLISLGSLWLLGVPWIATILTVAGVWIMVAVAARMTGETNINPLEQFGIFIGLVIMLLYQLGNAEVGVYASFMIVTFVSVACAVAGDAGHDYKSAKLIGTKFMDIIRVDLIAVLAASIAAPFILETIRLGSADQLFTPAMPAPQAQLVAGSIFGFEYPTAFLIGFAIAFCGEIINIFLPEKWRGKVMIMPAGIGLFLGLGLAIPIAIGALIRLYIDKHHAKHYLAGLLIAAGIMGGEGIAGFGNGALTVLLSRSALPVSYGYNGLMVLFVAVFILGLVGFLRQRGTA